MSVKIYLGCDLFVSGQRWQAKKVQTLIEEELGEGVDIYNPADNLDINDKSAGFASGSQILVADYNRLKESDILIALMDTQDLGLASEMGMAWERNIPVFQLYTDIRLTGNGKQDKIEELSKDIFQNDFLYINKLVTAISYVNKDGESYEEPLIYKTEEDLVKGVLKYIQKHK